MKTKIEKSEKTICFSREKFFEYENERQNLDFCENPRWIFEQPPRFRAGRPCWPLHALCVFLCTPSLIAKWEPLEETSVREKQKTLKMN